MEESAPQQDWLSYETKLMGIMGVGFAKPQGDVVHERDRLAIGVIQIDSSDRILVIPRRGLTAVERRTLFDAACTVWLRGTRRGRWREGALSQSVSTVYVRRQVFVAARSAISISSSEGVSSSQSSWSAA